MWRGSFVNASNPGALRLPFGAGASSSQTIDRLPPERARRGAGHRVLAIHSVTYQTPASESWAPRPSSLGAAPTAQLRADLVGPFLAGAVMMDTTPCVVSAAVHKP